MCGKLHGLLPIAHGAVFAGLRGDARFVELSVAPVEIDHKDTACAQSFHVAVAPRVGQRRQEVQAADVTLEEHFGHARRTAEVSIDLERRMHIPEVVGRTIF